MLCLVADNTGEEQASSIGQVIGARLRAAMKSRGWTQGQVHYQANAGQPSEIVSMATVSALVRGAIASPSVASTIAVARALDLTLDEVVGIKPLPQTPTAVSAPPPDPQALETRLARIESALPRIEQALRQLGAYHATEALADQVAAEVLEQEADDAQRDPATKRHKRAGRRATE